jgi:DNA-3-methyladenine glycosylase
VAPELLNKLLVHGGRAGRIVEVEAYVGSLDAGSHAFRGMTPRNATMFGRGGLLYVYFTYGMHWCANAVCGREGEGLAVLIRALAPVSGVEEMAAARGASVRARDLCNGPAKLTQALGIDGSFDGADLVTGDRGVVLAFDGTPPPPSAYAHLSTKTFWRHVAPRGPGRTPSAALAPHSGPSPEGASHFSGLT